MKESKAREVVLYALWKEVGDQVNATQRNERAGYPGHTDEVPNGSFLLSLHRQVIQVAGGKSRHWKSKELHIVGEDRVPDHLGYLKMHKLMSPWDLMGYIHGF